MAGGAPRVCGAGTRSPAAGDEECEAEETTPNENTQGNSLHSKRTHVLRREGLCQRGKEAWVRSGEGLLYSFVCFILTL